MSGMRRKALVGTIALGLGATHAAIGFSAQAEDAKLHALLNETCAACHGPDGNSLVPNFPSLAGQQKTYLLREMLDFKEGRRNSEMMSPLMTQLSQEEMAKLAEYYAGQKPVAGTVFKPDLLALGKRIYLEGNTESGVPSCDGCHEENGEGSKKFPRVAGQHVAYTLEQIAQYATGKRRNGIKVMRAIAERLTKEEAEAVAEYMASLK